MRQVLFYIPLTRDWDLGPLGSWPGFGFGILLGIWAIVGSLMIGKEWARQRAFNHEFISAVVYWFVIAALITCVPMVVENMNESNLAAYQQQIEQAKRLGKDFDIEQPRPLVELPVYGYGMMLVMAVIASSKVAASMAQKIGIEPQFMWDLVIKLVVTGVVGARLFYLVQYHDKVYRHCQGLGDCLVASIRLMDGGLVLYGGLILATLMALWIAHVNKIPKVKFVDTLVPAIFIGIAFGRIGCFMNGCCYGDPTDLPWGVEFPAESVPWAAYVSQGFQSPGADCSLALHPTQLYSAFNAFVLCWLTAVYYEHRSGDGAVIALGLMAYSVSRISIEILRGDELGKFGTTFTISQWISFGVFLLGAAFLWWSWTRSKSTLTSPVPNPISPNSN